jgi:serine O-acetyltransferase
LKEFILVEVALKEQDGIDVSVKDKKLEEDYNNFIEAMNSIKKSES